MKDCEYRTIDDKKYKKYFDRQITRHYDLGRNALTSVLLELGLSYGQKILLPTLICKEVVQSIRQLKLVPVYYDVDKILQPLIFPKDKEIKVLLVVNYFGFFYDLDPAKRYCAKNNVFLIEDNAHGLLGFDNHGKLLGARGDFGIFSYRKFFPLNGGAFYLNNTNLKLKSKFEFSVSNTPFIFFIKFFIYYIQFVTNISCYSSLKIFLLNIYNSSLNEKLFEAENGFFDSVTSHVSRLSFFIFNLINLEKEKERRRDLYVYFEKICQDLGGTGLFDSLPSSVCPYGFPFYYDETVSPLLVIEAEKKGLRSYRWPELPDEVATNSAHYLKKIWIINFSV
jgi:hypothetical protein